jgi:uncharacterized membrane protein HdeD (DUF308 family)
MKEIFKKWKWAEYVEAALLIILGVLIICFNNDVNLYAIIGYMVGIYFTMNAVLLITASITFGEPLLSGNFISGLILLTFGIVLFVDPLLLVETLPLIVGVGLITLGVILIARSIKGFVVFGFKALHVIQLIFGIIAAALGSTVLSIYYSGAGSNVVSIIFVLLGIVLLVAGIIQLCFTLYIAHHAKKFSNFVESEVVGDIEENSKEK